MAGVTIGWLHFSHSEARRLFFFSVMCL